MLLFSFFPDQQQLREEGANTYSRCQQLTSGGEAARQGRSVPRVGIFGLCASGWGKPLALSTLSQPEREREAGAGFHPDPQLPQAWGKDHLG